MRPTTADNHTHVESQSPGIQGKTDFSGGEELYLIQNWGRGTEGRQTELGPVSHRRYATDDIKLGRVI